MSASRRRRQGFVLLLALLILFVVVAIAAGLTQAVLSGMGIARASNDAIPAYFAAETGVERALWIANTFRRAGVPFSATKTFLEGLSPLDASVCCGTTTLQHPVVSSTTFTVATLRQNEAVTLDLFDPDDFTVGSGVGALRVSATQRTAGPTPWLELTRTELDFGAEQLSPVTTLFRGSGTAPADALTTENCTPSSPCTVTIPSATLRYRVRITALYGDVDGLTIEARDDAPTPVPVSIPGRLEIKGIGSVPSATNPRAQQALTATINWLTPASPLFDYTLFSQELLDKR